MSNYSPPPIQTPIINKEKEAFGLLAPEWTLYINQTYTGDTGTSFVPTYTNLTIAGTPTVTGAYYRDGQFIDFVILLLPGTSTTSTQGSTYFSLPFDVLSDDGCFVVSGLVCANGAVDAATNRIYTPTWTAVTVPLTMRGRVRAA